LYLRLDEHLIGKYMNLALGLPYDSHGAGNVLRRRCFEPQSLKSDPPIKSHVVLAPSILPQIPMRLAIEFPT
jgi:hypothetical protein